jgi:hypothetical protein
MSVTCSIRKNGPQQQAVGLKEENGGAMASKLVDGPEEEYVVAYFGTLY